MLVIFSLTLTSTIPVNAGFGDLSDEEIAGVIFMREEEKLARDAYLTFADLYTGYSIFSNIASSEQQHMDSIKRIIDRYDLYDPVGDNLIGEFTDDSLQDLYNAQISEGSVSLINALQVGAAIEEIDILDLEKYIESTDEWMIKRIYNNLLDGSENHLRAFVKELNMQGVTYQPQYLDEETFNNIIDADSDSGKNGNNWGNFIDWIRGLSRGRNG
jgi:hypothetical protein